MTMPHKLTPDDLGSRQNMGEIALSPDGRRVAFVLSTFNQEKNDTFSSIYLLLLDENGVATASPCQLTHASKKDGSPVWAADSRRLLFISDREQGNQLWLIDSAGGEARKLTHMPYGISEAAWSPDGQMIAFTARTRASVEDDLLNAQRFLAEATKQDLAEQERPTHVFVMPAPADNTAWHAPAEIRRLTVDEGFYRMPLWTPDSRELGVLQASHAHAASFVTDLWAIDVSSGAGRCLTEGNIEAETYSWAPDGQSAAVVGARDRNTSDSALAQLFLVTRHGNVGDHPLCVSPDFTYDTSIKLGHVFSRPGPYRPQWSNDGQKIFFLASVSGSVYIYQLDVVWRTITQLNSSASLTVSIMLFPDGQHLLAAQKFSDHPWELYRLPAMADAAAKSERLTPLYTQ